MSDVKTFVRLPVLLDRELHPVRPLHPKPLTLTEKLRGASEATMRLAKDEEPPALRSFVRIYTQNGDAGVYRVSSVSRSPATGETTVTLLHGRDVFSDTVILQPELAFTGNAQQLLTYALANQTHFVNDVPLWRLGTVANVAVEARTLSYDRASDVLSSIESELVDYHFEYDMSGFPWELSLVPNSAEVASEFRLSRNLERVSITVNDADLCNRLILSANHESTTAAAQDGKATPDTEKTTAVTQYFTYQDLASINEWGVCVKTADIDVGDDLAHGVHTEADAWAARFLAMRKNPQLQIQLSGLELCRLTGCDLDRVRLGMLSRVALPDHQVWFQERVVSINRQDVLDEPERITVSMANTLPRFSESLARIRQETAANTAAARSSRRSRSVTEKEVTHWEQVVRRTWGAVDGTGLAQLHESGVVVDADQGVKIYSLIQGDQSMLGQLQVNAAAITAEVQRATGSEGTLQANITAQADRISAEVTRATGAENTLSGRVSVTESQVGMVVEKKNGENVIKSAEIIAAINGDKSSVQIDADKIGLAGYTVAGDFEVTGSLTGHLYGGVDATGEGEQVLANVGNFTELYLNESTDMGDAFVSVTDGAYVDNVKTVTFTKANGGTQTITFSRAIASWTAVAGNGAVTMTANPQNQALTHAVKPIKVNDSFGSTFTSNVYNGDAIVSGIGMKLVANTTDNVVEARLVDSTLASDTLLAKLPVTFGGNVTFGDWTWNSYAGSSYPSQRTVSIDAADSGGGSDTASLSMMLSPRGWNKEGAGAYKQYVNLYAPNTDNTVRAQVTVDATSLVSNAPVSGSWDADTQTFTAAVDTSGSSQTASTKVLLTVQKASSTSDLNDKLDVLVHHDSATGTNLIANKRVTLTANNTAAAALSNTNTTRTGSAKVRAGISSTYYAEFGHTIAVDGGSDIATAGGTSDVTFSLDGVVVGRKRVKATYPGDASGNVDLDTISVKSGSAYTYSQTETNTYVTAPLTYTLKGSTKTGEVAAGTIKYPFSVALSPEKNSNKLKVSATVTGTDKNGNTGRSLTVRSGEWVVSSSYTPTTNGANNIVTVTPSATIGTLTAFAGSASTLGYLRQELSASGNTVTVTGLLRKLNSDNTAVDGVANTIYGKATTDITLAASAATIGPGETSVVSAGGASVSVTGRELNLKAVTITPTTAVQTISVPNTHDGFGTITVNAAEATGGEFSAWDWAVDGDGGASNTIKIGIMGTTKQATKNLFLTEGGWINGVNKITLRPDSTTNSGVASVRVNAPAVSWAVEQPYLASAYAGQLSWRDVTSKVASPGGGALKHIDVGDLDFDQCRIKINGEYVAYFNFLARTGQANIGYNVEVKTGGYHSASEYGYDYISDFTVNLDSSDTSFAFYRSVAGSSFSDGGWEAFSPKSGTSSVNVNDLSGYKGLSTIIHGTPYYFKLPSGGGGTGDRLITKINAAPHRNAMSGYPDGTIFTFTFSSGNAQSWTTTSITTSTATDLNKV